MLSRRRVLCIAASLPLAMPVSTQAADSLIVGIMVPVTGKDAAIGERMTAAAMAAAKYFNTQGGVNGHMFDVRIADTNSGALLVANRLLSLDVQYSLVYGSSAASSISSSFRDENVLCFIISNNSALTPNPAFLRITPTNEAYAKPLADRVQSGQLVAVISEDSGNGNNMQTAVLDALDKRGIDPRPDRVFKLAPDHYDYNEIITRLQSLHPEVTEVILTSGMAAAARFERQARQAGASWHFLGASEMIYPDFADIADIAVDGTEVVAVTGPNLDNITDADTAAALESFGLPLGDLEIEVFTTFKLIRDGAQKAQSLDPKAVKDQLQKGIYHAPLGPIHFDENGDVQGISLSVAVWRRPNAASKATLERGPRIE